MQFPPIHKTVLKHVIVFMKTVAEKSTANKMNEQNMCIVFGPNLIRNSQLTALEGLVDTARILDSVQLLITQSKVFFADPSYGILPNINDYIMRGENRDNRSRSRDGSAPAQSREQLRTRQPHLPRTG